MGLFDSINRTHQLGADILAIQKIVKELFKEIDCLILELDRSKGLVGSFENSKIEQIGRKINNLTEYSARLGKHFSSVTVEFGPNKLLLPGAIIMLFQITDRIEGMTGFSFRVNKEL